MYKTADEWDLDSTSRKFRQQHCIFQKPDGTLSTHYIYQVQQKGDGYIFLGPDGNSLAKAGLPVYCRVPSGWYNGKNGPVLIIRKAQKTFGQGVSNNNYLFYALGDGGELGGYSYSAQDVFNFHEPQRYNIDEAIKNFGPISRDFALSKTAVLFRDSVIGLREKSIFSVQDWATQELQDVTKGTKCRVLA